MSNMRVPGGHSGGYSSSRSFSAMHGSMGASAPAPGGRELTDVNQLPPQEKARFLNQHDPLRSIRELNNPNTSLYRITEGKYIQRGHIAGNPDSCARVNIHQRLKPDTFARTYMQAQHGTAEAYLPASGNAMDLGPSLNVMAGSGALQAVRLYRNNNSSENVIVKMKLGDFLNRGGCVFKDTSSVASSDDSHALIVTLPHPHTVPAQIIE